MCGDTSGHKLGGGLLDIDAAIVKRTHADQKTNLRSQSYQTNLMTTIIYGTMRALSKREHTTTDETGFKCRT